MDDHNGATAVLGEVLADRSEQEPGEAAAPTRADHDHLRDGVEVEEAQRRRTLEHLERHVDVRVLFAEHLLHRFLDDVVRGVLELLGREGVGTGPTT